MEHATCTPKISQTSTPPTPVFAAVSSQNYNPNLRRLEFPGNDLHCSGDGLEQKQCRPSGFFDGETPDDDGDRVETSDFF
ncbi:unnamed protein product [Cuscuta campestris]|uniref:Uncharacterized protein n=1 Tax=Cuscuta campestris TaxID=132261 RepID=A0A484MA44_9ASTE|nr:unnamed protein product [Cuscuta campestris]